MKRYNAAPAIPVVERAERFQPMAGIAMAG